MNTRIAARNLSALAVLCLTPLATAAHAQSITLAVGHYYTQAVLVSVTATNGASQSDCTTSYGTAGAQSTGIAQLSSVGSSGNLQIDLRGGVLGSSGTYGYQQSIYVQGTGSTFANQTGKVTIYVNGKKLGGFPYTATTTLFDTQSFSALASATLPSPTLIGSCVETLQATFTYSGK